VKYHDFHGHFTYSIRLGLGIPSFSIKRLRATGGFFNLFFFGVGWVFLLVWFGLGVSLMFVIVFWVWFVRFAPYWGWLLVGGCLLVLFFLLFGAALVV
jgi:hypothetical protein